MHDQQRHEQNQDAAAEAWIGHEEARALLEHALTAMRAVQGYLSADNRNMPFLDQAIIRIENRLSAAIR